MRIMATSDLHGNLEGIDPKGADVVVLAGDNAPLHGRGVWHINDQTPNISDHPSLQKPLSRSVLASSSADTYTRGSMVAWISSPVASITSRASTNVTRLPMNRHGWRCNAIQSDGNLQAVVNS